jgi:PadR family transcriptional regulator, regulatory protein PadR
MSREPRNVTTSESQERLNLGIDSADYRADLTGEPPGGGRPMAKESEELVRGTLDALILKTLTWGPRHGYGIAGWIKETSRDTLAVEDRALYLALHRLEDKGWVESDWGLSDNNRRAKFYQLTARGRAQLRAESSRLARYAEGLFRVLDATAWEGR